MTMLALSSMSTEVCARKAASVKYSTAKSERTPSKCNIFDTALPVTSLQWQWHLAVKHLQALGEETIPPPATPILSSKVQVLKQDFGGSGLKKWVPCPHFHTVNGTHLTDFSCKESEECEANLGVLWVTRWSLLDLGWSPVLPENPFSAKNPNKINRSKAMAGCDLCRRIFLPGSTFVSSSSA